MTSRTSLKRKKEFKKLQREYNSAEDKEEWLEDHPEYKELETSFKKARGYQGGKSKSEGAEVKTKGRPEWSPLIFLCL